ncbi:ubiquitin carboxyl-terminal [Lynx pardinus]|uniref:Ubiquitin carboxyl-terminal hydrolase n=1 Tax=Lynx pardinus TaxID=191816 RepID=A0A485MCE8_LYNPA|nr:ubiquitin carboxyl-terminal [Lynx pardinus]
MHLTSRAHWTARLGGGGLGTVGAAVCGGAAAGVMAELSEEALLSVLPTIRVPKAGDRVHKDECAFSFDTPESEGGLYICMNTFLGFGKQYVERHFNKTGQRVYLHLRRTRRPKEEDTTTGTGDPPRKKPTRLAIGVEGGFDLSEEKYEYDEDVKIVILPDYLEIARDGLGGLPDIVRDRVTSAVEALLSADSASRKQEVQAWDGEVRQVSKHAFNLKQLDNPARIPPCGWKCSKCDMRENLWLNLTDGSILCGRRYFDGSGGNNHAVEHYRETNYPLAVKLGTITPDGADVYSYDEDDMVLDPNLAEHLSHFGIDMLKMQKTDKTMTELEIDMNQRIGEWELIQESSVPLKPLFGPGYTGIRNLGNSCYLNSVVQVLFSIPDFQRKYVDKLEKIFQNAPTDPTQDFSTQVAKLGHGLLSGEYSKPAPESGDGEQVPEQKEVQDGIAPRMFKALIGKGHPEFSTNRQQDAQEFFLHLINMVERNCRSSENPNEVFRFLVEEKIKCLATEKVKYTQRVDYIMQLPVPMDAALNKEELLEYEEKKRQAEEEKLPLPELVRAQVPFSSCLEAYGAPEQVDDFWSTALQAKSVAVKVIPKTLSASLPSFCPFVVGFSGLATVGAGNLAPRESRGPGRSRLGRWTSNASLLSKNNSLERAVDWIFSHIDDLDAEAAMDISEGRSAADSISESVPVGPKVRDGPGKYQLFAFISHMGTSTMCGHYVCHIKKEGRWVIYNDQKVCASEKPPKDLGYIYFYQRVAS